MTVRVFVGGSILAGAMAVAVAAQGQAQQPPPGGGRGGQAPQNLQVLPKDTPRQQVIQTMQRFTQALGVDCQHCHVSQQDRASDEKPAKNTARAMLKMMAGANEQLKGVGDPAVAQKVTCFTCHRGALKPLTQPAAAGGW
jgi:hypothetical protein